MIGPLLSPVAGVEQAFVYGSWADRYLGRSGDEPADLDVMVIGAPRRMELSRIARELGLVFGRDVNITAVSAAAWEATESGFLRDVKLGPLVEIGLGRAGDE